MRNESVRHDLTIAMTALMTSVQTKLRSRKVWAFHGGGCKECGFLGQKAVPTSYETYFVSVTEPSRLILCNI
jgi:hypothetical protein